MDKAENVFTKYAANVALGAGRALALGAVAVPPVLITRQGMSDKKKGKSITKGLAQTAVPVGAVTGTAASLGNLAALNMQEKLVNQGAAAAGMYGPKRAPFRIGAGLKLKSMAHMGGVVGGAATLGVAGFYGLGRLLSKNENKIKEGK